MVARGLVGPLLLSIMGAPVAGVPAQVPAGTVDIAVTVDAAGRARVEERYVVAPAPPAVELRALMRRCAEVGRVTVERDGTQVPVITNRARPWLVFQDTTAGGGDTLRLVVRYDVRLTARHVDVPLLYMTRPIPQRDGVREGAVRVLVRLSDPVGRVRFPHLTRETAAEWGARLVAIPSFVAVSIGGDESGTAGECRTSVVPVGDDGGLVWRFFLFVGIMAAWVPLYLWWAGRSREEDE